MILQLERVLGVCFKESVAQETLRICGMMPVYKEKGDDYEDDREIFSSCGKHEKD